MEDFEPIGSEEVMAQKSKKPMIIILALLVVVVVLGFFMGQMNKPRFVFDQAIDAFTSFKVSEEFTTLKVDGDLAISVTGDDVADDETAMFINNAKLTYDVELDKAQKQELVALRLTSAEDELINLKLKLDSATEKMYLNLGEIFEKTIELDASDLSSETTDIFDTTELTFGQKVSRVVALQILRQEIKTQLLDEYFSAEKVTVDGENLTKNTLKMTGEQLNTAIKNVCDNLLANENFLSCFEDSQKVEDLIADWLISVEDMCLEDYTSIEISCYTAGFSKEVKRVDVIFDDEQTTSGKVKVVVNSGSYAVEAIITEYGVEMAIKVSGNVIYDEPMSEFDVSNAVKSDELTDADYMELFNNFMNSKLYDIYEGSLSSGFTLDSDDSDDDYYTDDDFLSDDEETSETAGEPNILHTYNEQIVKFNVPDGYDCYSSESDKYKLFEKELEDDYLDVDVGIDCDTMDEYAKYVKEIMEEYQNDEDYVNVNFAEDEIEFNGNRFKRMILTYDYVYWNDEKTPSVEVYIAHQVDSQNLYVVEASGPEMISDQDLAQFLLIEK